MKLIHIVVKQLLSILIERNKLSIGRLLLISVFVLAMIKWSANIDLPSSMLQVFIALLGYVLGSKFINSLNNTAIKSNNNKVKEDEEIK